MSLEDTIKSMYNHTKNVYDGIVKLGGTAPAEKNLANLVAAFDTLPVKPYDPKNPTIKGIAAAVKAGDFDAFPVGTEIPDQWDGQDNPLIVAQYLDSSNNSAYDGDVGVILMRKYVDPISKVYNSAGMTDYDSSELYDYLANEYYTKCTPELRENIDRIHEPFLQYNGDRMLHGYSNIFLMSGIEVGGTYNDGEGIFWDYWKQKTGLSSPSNATNNGRIMRDRNGTIQSVWLRSHSASRYVCLVNPNGYVNTSDPNYSYGVLACCFIAKSNLSTTYYTVTFEADGATNVPVPQTVAGGG